MAVAITCQQRTALAAPFQEDLGKFPHGTMPAPTVRYPVAKCANVRFCIGWSSRQSGDLHGHFFGTATLSVADGIKTQAGDVFEIDSPTFGLPLINPLAFAPAQDGAQTVTAL